MPGIRPSRVIPRSRGQVAIFWLRTLRPLVERFTRVAPDRIDYAITVDDPTTWTKPWTTVIRLKRSAQRLFRIRLPRRQLRDRARDVRGGASQRQRPLTRAPRAISSSTAAFLRPASPAPARRAIRLRDRSSPSRQSACPADSRHVARAAVPICVRDLLVEWEDRVGVITRDRAEPTRQASRLRDVATMADGFNALAQLADRDRREEQRDALRRSIPKEPTNTGVGANSLSRVADDVGVDQVHRGRHARRSIWRRSKSASSPASGIAASTRSFASRDPSWPIPSRMSLSHGFRTRSPSRAQGDTGWRSDNRQWSSGSSR